MTDEQNPISLSEPIDHTMDGIEEGNAKRRLNYPHAPRPQHARLIDTLNSPPENGAPVIVNLVSEPQSFDKLSLLEKKHFINGLIDTIGTVKDGTKWTKHGQLYIYPTSNRQKKNLLELHAVKEFQITCSLSKSETELKGIIYNVPINNSDNDLLELLSNQGVIKVKRFHSGPEGGKSPLTTVALFFNSKILPSEVIVAHEIFRVKKFIPRPSQCRKCWSLQHQEDTCQIAAICRYCAQQHPPSPSCPNPLLCPTCHKSGHAAGSNKQKVIRFAYENNIPISEAGKLLDRRDHQAKPIHLPSIEQENPEILALRREVKQLKQQMDNLLLSPPITELTTRVANLESELATVKEQIEPLVALPTIVDQNNKEMRKGFTDTQEQLAKLHSLLERVISPNLRPPAKPNPVTSTNQNTPKK
jgi:hypothetical protein